MSKKLSSTILLLIIGVGFLLYGIQSLVTTIQAPGGAKGESIVFSLIYIVVAIYAFGSVIMLPRKSE